MDEATKGHTKAKVEESPEREGGCRDNPHDYRLNGGCVSFGQTIKRDSKITIAKRKNEDRN